MHRIVPIVAGASHLALQTVADGSALSKEADVVYRAAKDVLNWAEQSSSIFGENAAALSNLAKIAKECADAGWDGEDSDPVDPVAVVLAERFIRAMRYGIPMPEFAVDPDGAISLDWIQSKDRIFSLSISAPNRLSFAWLDGAERGHATAQFDGRNIPARVLDQITALVGTTYASVWAA
jgi:hypothetical protein